MTESTHHPALNFKGREEQHRAYSVTSRRWIAKGSDVFVKEFTLVAGEEIPWHHHSNVFDVFYCIEGTLIVEVRDIASGKAMPALTMKVGESAKVEVGTAHRPYNPGPGNTRFVLIQGVGPYDYLAYQPT